LAVWRDRQDFDSEFMAQNARIVEKRLPARERVEVRAADTDAMDADERFVRNPRLGMAPGTR
jgi:hypothetical protein